MQVIPAIDLISGRVVRLRKGRYEEATVYDDPPATIAAGWRGIAERVHVVDLHGARDGSPVQRDVIRTIVTAFGRGVQVGGGIRNREVIEAYFAIGVERVVLGTAAIRDPELLESAARDFPHRIILAVDARGGRVATQGWLDQSDQRAVDLVQRYAALPLAAVLYTDIERDGTEVGPNVTETAALARDGGLPVIASGGVGNLDHLRRLASCGVPLAGAIVGRALHERRFSLSEAVAAAAAPA